MTIDVKSWCEQKRPEPKILAFPGEIWVWSLETIEYYLILKPSISPGAVGEDVAEVFCLSQSTKKHIRITAYDDRCKKLI